MTPRSALRRWLTVLCGFAVCGCAAVSMSTAPVTWPAHQQWRGVYHEVVQGDTLSHIARTYQINADTLRQVNRLQQPDQLVLGQFIFVPDAR